MQHVRAIHRVTILADGKVILPEQRQSYGAAAELERRGFTMIRPVSEHHWGEFTTLIQAKDGTYYLAAIC